jgi:hypothetical protein
MTRAYSDSPALSIPTSARDNRSTASPPLPARNNRAIVFPAPQRSSRPARTHERVQRLAGWIVREENPAGVVYGTILVAALIAAESGLHDGYPAKVGSTVLALAVYWLAHSYATVLGRRLSHEEHLTVGALGRAFAHEWSIVRGAAIPLLTLLVAWAVGANEAAAVNAAIWAAIASLILFELLAGLRAGSTAREFALESAIGVTMGLAILSLKSLAH